MTSERDPLTVVVRHAGVVDVVWTSGELDLFTAPRLQEALAVQDPRGAAHLVLDLRCLEFLDSTGIRTIVEAGRHRRASGGRTVLVTSVDTTVTKVLGILGVDRVMERVPSLEVALRSLGVEPAGSALPAASA